MTFRQFIFHNVFRNFRLYAAYFFSSMFTVSVFFTFAIFGFHPTLTGDDMNSNVVEGLSVAGGIIYLFSFFFVLYSMSTFLRSRKKEFGVLLVHGMSNSQIRWMVFSENVIIGFFSTVIGILLGIVFSKAILLIAENVLIIDESLDFYFPILAIVVTFVSFMFLFFFISIFTAFLLRTKKIVTFIKGDENEREEPKFSPVLSILAVLLLGSGYAIALSAKGLQVVTVLLPVVILVTIGTYLLFSQLSIYVIHKLKQHKSLFWRNTNILLFADLAYRMKDNAKAFFLVAIISTVAFSAIGSLFGMNSYLTKGIIEANPTSISYNVTSDMTDEEIEKDIQLIEETLEQNYLAYNKESTTLHYFLQGNDDREVLIVPVSEYNKYASFLGEKQIDVSDHEAIPVDKSIRTIEMPGGGHVILDNIEFADGSTIPVNWDKLGIAKPDLLPEMFEYYIVSDSQFEKLNEPVHISKVFDWDVIKGDKEVIVEVGRTLNDKVTGNLIALDFMVHTVREIYSPIMFVGLFIGIIFFVSAGSFLYFRLYSDLDEDEVKFNRISKLGLAPKELKKVISEQTAILFFVPIVVAVIHGSIALYALSNLFDYRLVTESAIVLGSFFVIQVIYYFIVRHFYIRQLSRTI